MTSYKEYKKKALVNPEVKAEYDALQPEYNIIQAMIDARKKPALDTERIVRENRYYPGRYQQN